MRNETGDWTTYRNLDLCIEVDFHRGPREPGTHYENVMAEVSEEAELAVQRASAMGLRYVLFTHGSSTSVGWKGTTARSQIRQYIRSPAATPYVNRTESIQHPSVFVAALKPVAGVTPPALACPSCSAGEINRRTEVGHFECQVCRHQFNWFNLER